LGIDAVTRGLVLARRLRVAPLLGPAAAPALHESAGLVLELLVEDRAVLVGLLRAARVGGGFGHAGCVPVPGGAKHGLDEGGRAAFEPVSRWSRTRRQPHRVREVEPMASQHTPADDIVYDLVTIQYHALKAAEATDKYLKDA